MPLILYHTLIFQNVFHGPLHIFGKLFYEQMVTNGHHGHEKVKDRISCEQFVKAGKEVLKLFSDSDQHKYYFKLFSQGKDHLTREGMAFWYSLSRKLIYFNGKTVVSLKIMNVPKNFKKIELYQTNKNNAYPSYCEFHNL